MRNIHSENGHTESNGITEHENGSSPVVTEGKSTEEVPPSPTFLSSWTSDRRRSWSGGQPGQSRNEENVNVVGSATATASTSATPRAVSKKLQLELQKAQAQVKIDSYR
jgi:hypothetical protein